MHAKQQGDSPRDLQSPEGDRREPSAITLAVMSRLDRGQLVRLVLGYVLRRSGEQLRLVVPVAAWLIAFQWLVLRQPVLELTSILLGLVAVVFGLTLFLEGLRVGLMPLGEALGRELPVHSTVARVLAIAFVLGIGVTFAEPAIAALAAAAALVEVTDTPYLYALLELWRLQLVLAVGVGVGLAALVGMLRLLQNWSLKPLLYAALLPTLALTVAFSRHPDLRELVALAWDCGAVTTGPVTVPIVLALGVGVASAVGTRGNPLAGFGVVTLASLFPVLCVLLLGLAAFWMLTPEEIIAAAAAREGALLVATDQFRSPFQDVLEALRAVVPLVLFLIWVLVRQLRCRVPRPVEIGYGIVLCVLGMALFKIGLVNGLTALGEQVGGLLPTALMPAQDGRPPLHGPWLGIMLVLLFGAVIGLAATMAEPALNALGTTVEELTDGTFRNRTLRLAVAVGVASGITLGVVKLLFDLPLAWFLVPGYLLAIALTWMSREDFVNVAWDSAGVTTGPVTVPLVLAMGLGLGGAVGALQGFGILAMASVGPILSVLATGLWAQWQAKRRSQRAMR